MKKNYNTYRTKLHLPEYGRHIHDMVDALLTIKDREERNRKAKSIIAVMGNIQPLLRDTPDFAHKLWDHLFIISDFQLDIDSPYPIPTAKTLTPIPERMEYPRGRIMMKHYGKNVRKVVRALEKNKEQDIVDAVIFNLALYMRTKSYEYNQEHPDNWVIIKDIKNMSEGGIIVDEEAISHIKSEYKQPFVGRNKKTPYPKKNQKNSNQRRNFSK